MVSMQRQRWMGYGLTAVGATLFSTKAIFIKLAFREDVNASLMLAWRMIFSAPFFLLIGVWAIWNLRAAGKSLPDRRHFMVAASIGVLGYSLSAYLDFKGLEFISAQLERLVLFTYPIFVMFLGGLIFGHRVTRYGLVACLITYSGLAIVFGVDLPKGGWNTIVGTLLVLACAVTFALNQLFSKGQIAVLGAALFTAVSMLVGGMGAVVLHMLIKGGFAASHTFLLLTFGCAVFATVLPILCVNAGLARISAQAVAMISTVSPIVTIALAVWILGEPFTWADALGSSLVLAGVGLYTWKDMRSTATASRLAVAE